jgi:hypothetical protein
MYVSLRKRATEGILHVCVCVCVCVCVQKTKLSSLSSQSIPLSSPKSMTRMISFRDTQNHTRTPAWAPGLPVTLA